MEGNCGLKSVPDPFTATLVILQYLHDLGVFQAEGPEEFPACVARPQEFRETVAYLGYVVPVSEQRICD